MDSLKFALVACGLTAIFALIIACFIPLLAFVIKKMNIERANDQPDPSVPSSDSMKEDEIIAVAIAVAHFQRK